MTSNFITGDYPILYSSFSNFISDKFSFFFENFLILFKFTAAKIVHHNINLQNMIYLYFLNLRMDRNGCTAPLAVLLACSGQFSSEYHPLFRYPENCDSQSQFSQNSRLPSCNNEFPPPLQRTLRKFSKPLSGKHLLSVSLKSLS